MITDTVNSYQVTFVLPYTTISTCVFAMHEEACADLAREQIYEDLGFDSRSSFLHYVEDIQVQLLDRDVL